MLLHLLTAAFALVVVTAGFYVVCLCVLSKLKLLLFYVCYSNYNVLESLNINGPFIFNIQWLAVKIVQESAI